MSNEQRNIIYKTTTRNEIRNMKKINKTIIKKKHSKIKTQMKITIEKEEEK